MKKMFKTLMMAFVAVAAIGVTGCSKDDDTSSTSNPTPTNNTITTEFNFNVSGSGQGVGGTLTFTPVEADNAVLSHMPLKVKLK